MSASGPDRYRPETRLVHSGTLRSQFGETSEAMFLTQGYVYDNSAQAERRFNNEEPGFQYSRFANPTVAMFEERMAAFEGAEAARATATGMAAVTLALTGQVKAGDHVVAAKALFGSCRYIVCGWLSKILPTHVVPDRCTPNRKMNGQSAVEFTKPLQLCIENLLASQANRNGDALLPCVATNYFGAAAVRFCRFQ